MTNEIMKIPSIRTFRLSIQVTLKKISDTKYLRLHIVMK